MVGLRGGLIDGLKDKIEGLLNNGDITEEQAEQAETTVEEQGERLEEISQNQEQAENLKKEGKVEEAKKLEEENKKIQKEVDQQLQSISKQLGIDQKDTNDIASIQKDDSYDGLIIYGKGKNIFKHQRLDNNVIVDFTSKDRSSPPPDELNYSFTHDGKVHNIIVTHSGSAPGVFEAARERAKNPKNEELNLHLHYDTAVGTMGYTVDFGSGYLDKLDPIDYEEVLTLYQKALYNSLFNQTLDTDGLVKAIKDGLLDTYDTFKQILYKVKLPEDLWDQYTHKNEEYYMDSLFAGLTDGVIDEIKSIPLLISLVVDLTTNEKTQNQIWEAITAISVNEIYNKFVDTRSKLYTSPNTDKIKHQTGKDIVAMGTLFGSGGLAGLGKIKKGTEFVKELAEKAKKLTTAVVKFNTKQIDNYVLFATKQGDKSKVMLGKYLDGGSNSYIRRAGGDHTYFDLGSVKWREAEALVNKNTDEMWKINKKFIDQQKALNKEFYFSQEPWKAQGHEYLSKEAEYLIDLGAKDFLKINLDTWKVIW